MGKQKTIHTVKEVQNYKSKIINSINERLKGFFGDGDGIEVLKKIKFAQSGFDPLFDEPINFIEMTNQVFTYLVCLHAVELLLVKHPTHYFHVNFGTESGYDVVSEDDSIICECFAVTTPDSNKKLKKDINKVFECKHALYKYIIFYTANQMPKYVENIRNLFSEVEVIILDTI